MKNMKYLQTNILVFVFLLISCFFSHGCSHVRTGSSITEDNHGLFLKVSKLRNNNELQIEIFNRTKEVILLEIPRIGVEYSYNYFTEKGIIDGRTNGSELEIFDSHFVLVAPSKGNDRGFITFQSHSVSIDTENIDPSQIRDITLTLRYVPLSLLANIKSTYDLERLLIISDSQVFLKNP